jgi:hypothetical protein
MNVRRGSERFRPEIRGIEARIPPTALYFISESTANSDIHPLLEAISQPPETGSGRGLIRVMKRLLAPF